jgi:hypothetical protein
MEEPVFLEDANTFRDDLRCSAAVQVPWSVWWGLGLYPEIVMVCWWCRFADGPELLATTFEGSTCGFTRKLHWRVGVLERGGSIVQPSKKWMCQKDGGIPPCWWFGTFFIYNFFYAMSSFPLTNSSFFKLLIAPPTRWISHSYIWFTH